ncbi:hypothetical protein [uncultured Roseobacter sp.]|uniref:hypothetical protein n=1 Tax=uncultured Roseobacter sp. TaxID=114847 RepID=UPI002601AD85|nr:hypothetical protein [uncultured Roseobacter sp.]
MSAPDHDLVTALRGWDGRSADDITALYTQFHQNPGFVEELVLSCRAPETERAATWLIKHHLEQSAVQFSKETRQQYYQAARHLTHWEARLHVLQCMDHIAIPPDTVEAVWSFAQAAATSDRKLLQAWGLYGLARIAHQFPDYQPAALEVLAKAAQQHPKGAVAVRLRKARALLA